MKAGDVRRGGRWREEAAGSKRDIKEEEDEEECFVNCAEFIL